MKHFSAIFRTPSKQKSPKEDKDIDIVELLRNVDPKEYEKYARMYGITDYRGLLQAIEQLKKEKGEESGRPVCCSVPRLCVFCVAVVNCITMFCNFICFLFYDLRNMNVAEILMRIWLGLWLICREEWNRLR